MGLPYESGTLAKLSYHGDIQRGYFIDAPKHIKGPFAIILLGMAGGRPRGPPEEVLPTALRMDVLNKRVIGNRNDTRSQLAIK